MISTRSTRSLDSFSALKLAKILEMMDMPPGIVNIVTEPGAIIEFSVSCGIADTLTSRSLPALFKAADDAMYMAKEQGRNRVALLPRAA